jgi:O-antigen/teichoic acid export membrane protein/peptidoglycan/xylan/chitin deacetylase (PgdA/CDA1 family)
VTEGKSRLTLLRNVAMLSIASYAELAFGLILGVVIARSLGSTEFGHYAFAVWACGTLITLSNNALTMSSIKFVAEVRGAGQMEVASALSSRLYRWHGISTAIVLVIFATVSVVHPPEEWRESFALMIPLLVVGAWARSGYMMMAAVGKGNERFEVESVALVLSALTNLLLVSALAWIGGSLAGFFAIYAVCGLLQNLAARILLRRFGILPKPKPLEPALAQRLKRHLLQSGVLVGVGLLGDRTIEVLLLKSFAASEAVGFFAIAGALTKGATYLLAGALTSVLLPAMSRAFGLGGSGSVVRMLPEAIRFYWFIGVAIAGLGATVAPGAVRLLYGAQYEDAIPAVMVNLMVAGFVLISAAFNAFQTSSDNQGDRIKIAAMTLGVNLVAGVALVPAFGLTGALASLAITKLAAVCFSWAFARRTDGVTMPVAPMIRVLGAALLASALAEVVDLVVMSRFAFVGAGVVFIVVYLVSTVVFRAWTRPDYDAVAEVFGRFGNRGQVIVALIHAAKQRFSGGVRRSDGPGKRDAVSAVIGSLGLTRVLGVLRSAAVKDLRVLAYHRVLADLDESRYAFDAELVSARREEFDWQMAYVARHFQPVTCAQVADAINAGTALPKRAVMVTFDDGFRDNYEVAFPVLKHHGVPGLFFVSTGYIDRQEPFWFDWIVHVFLQTAETRVHLEAIEETIELGATPQTRRAAALQLLRTLKRAPETKRLRVVEQLRQLTRVVMSPEALAQSAPMTWDHVREMSRAGMEFGSHTVSHPILSTISDPAALQLELGSSKARIEQETGVPTIALAYPVGGRNAVNEQVLQATAAAGYQFAFTYLPGVNKLSTSQRFMLNRIQVERYTSRAMFTAALELPEIFVR